MGEEGKRAEAEMIRRVLQNLRDKSGLTRLVVVKVIRFLKYILKIISTGFPKDLMWGVREEKRSQE